MQNAGLNEAQAGIKIARRNINNLRYADDTALLAESEENSRASWWKWKRRVRKLASNSTFRNLRSRHPVPSLHGKKMGKQWKQWQTLFGGLQNHCSHETKRRLLLGRKAMSNLGSIFKSRDITLPTKVYLVKVMVFPVIMYGCELDYKESWVPKNWCFRIAVSEKTLESPLDWRESKSVNPKGNQPWIFIGRTDAEAEAPKFWPCDAKSQLIGKDLDAGKD